MSTPREDPARSGPPRQLADDLWVVARPFRVTGLGDVGVRMTVIRLQRGELILHSPVPASPDLCEAIVRLGMVRHLVGPNRVHHLYLGEWLEAFPGAEIWGAPGLAEKRRDLTFHHVLSERSTAEWSNEVLAVPIAGIPYLREVALLHRASRTLVLTDLAFNLPTRPGLLARLAGVGGRFGPSRLLRLLVRDRGALAGSIAALLELDFDRVIVSHGEVLESGGHAAFEAAFSYLDAAASPSN